MGKTERYHDPIPNGSIQNTYKRHRDDGDDDDGENSIDNGNNEYSESHIYEHFPVVCPSCKGKGKICGSKKNSLSYK